MVTPSHFCIFLNFNEGAYLRVVPDLATVEVDKLRKLDVVSDLHIRRNAEVAVLQLRPRLSCGPPSFGQGLLPRSIFFHQALDG